MHSVLLFITWHVCVSAHYLVEPFTRRKQTQIHALLLSVCVMFILTFSMFLALCLRVFLSNVMYSHVPVFPSGKWLRVMYHPSPPTSAHQGTSSFCPFLFSYHIPSSLFCPLLLFFPNPFSLFFSHFLPLHHRLSAFSPFSPQPDGS